MPDRRPSLNERRLQEYIDGLIKSGGKLPKSPHRGSWRTHTVYLKAITAATKIPTPALCVDPLKALLEKAENQIGFVEDEVDMLAMAGKWVYLPDAARAFGCYQSKLVAIVNKGVLETKPYSLSHLIRIPDLSQVEFMGKATPFQRLKLWAFFKESTLPVRGAPNGAWFEKYNHARAAVRLAKFAVVPKDVALAGCDFLWTVKRTLPTVAALSRLFYSQRCEYVRQQKQRFLAITQEWRDGQSTFVPLLDEQVTPMQLARILSPQLLPIPFTCFDRDRPEESAAPHHSILRWLARIPEQRFRDALTLLAAIQAANGRAQHSVESFLRGLHSRLQEIRADVPEFEPFASRPDDVLRRVWEAEACKGMSPDSRNRLPLLWNNAARIFEVYSKKLNGVDRDRLFDFAFKLLQDHYYWRNQKPTEIINLMQKRRRKEKVDGITQKFYELRFDADVRFNTCGRLRENCLKTIEKARSGEVTPPYDFSYSERVTGASRRHAISQTVKLRLHSASSLVRRFRDSGISFPRSTLGTPDPGHHEKHEKYFVEYLGAESKDAGSGSQPFWFIDIFRHRLYSDNLQQDEKAFKERILTSNGYPTNEAFRLPAAYSPTLLPPRPEAVTPNGCCFVRRRSGGPYFCRLRRSTLLPSTGERSSGRRVLRERGSVKSSRQTLQRADCVRRSSHCRTGRQNRFTYSKPSPKAVRRKSPTSILIARRWNTSLR